MNSMLNLKLVRDGPEYSLHDDETSLEHLTVSRTVLNPDKYTRGHSHAGVDEVYFFESGDGWMNLGDKKDYRIVSSGSLVLVPGGTFHQVCNTSPTQTLVFYTVMEGRRE